MFVFVDELYASVLECVPRTGVVDGYFLFGCDGCVELACRGAVDGYLVVGEELFDCGAFGVGHGFDEVGHECIRGCGGEGANVVGAVWSSLGSGFYVVEFFCHRVWFVGLILWRL